MESQMTRHNVETDPSDCLKIMEWMAEAGVTIELIENQSTHACSVCQPADLHVAA